MRESQDKYNTLLRGFNAESKTFMECVNFLKGLGYTYEQAKNAVHGFRTGSPTKASIKRSRAEWRRILDEFDALHKQPKECINYLRAECDATYRQARSAVYFYRLEKGLVRK